MADEKELWKSVLTARDDDDIYIYIYIYVCVCVCVRVRVCKKTWFLLSLNYLSHIKCFLSWPIFTLNLHEIHGIVFSVNIIQKIQQHLLKLSWWWFDKIKCIYIYIYIYIVTWYPTETMEVGWLLFELTVGLGWHLVAPRNRPTRGRKREAKWLAGTPKRKWGLLPLSGNK